MKTIKTHIPSRKIGNNSTKPFDVTFNCDEQGRWTMTAPWCTDEPVFENEVIDICKNSNDWKNIRAKYFPMHGFHS